MTFIKGQSGNPKGRPPKGRALTEILESVLGEKHNADKTTLKNVMAEKIALAMATGVIEFPSGKKIRRVRLDGDQWLSLVKFIYSHVDGPARAELDVNTNTTAVHFYIPENGRGDAQADEQD